MLRRKIDCAFHTIFKELREEDSDGFKGLVHLLSSFLQKEDTNMSECINPEERCCVTLRYLASGEAFRSTESIPNQ